MKAAHAVAVLLAATACAVGMTVAVARSAATATLLLDAKVPTLNAGSSHLQGPWFEEDDPAVAEHSSRNGLTARMDDVAPADQTPHQCQPTEQTTPPAQASTQPGPSQSAPAQLSTGTGLSQSVSAQAAPPVSGSPTCGPDGTAGVLPIRPPKCTVNATNASQANSARAGDTVCFSGGSLAGSRLNITASGAEGAPITVTGDGKTTVKGVRVNANNVVVQGFNVIGAAAPGVQLKGKKSHAAKYQDRSPNRW